MLADTSAARTNVPLRLRHLLAVDVQEAVDVDERRQVEAGGLEHRRPEQRVEVGDVLADEVVDLGLGDRATSRRIARRAAGTILASRPCSRSARRTRRTRSCRGCRESRSRSRAPAATRPSRAAARAENALADSWRSRGCKCSPLCVHSSRKPCNRSIFTNRCGAVRISGVAPVSVLTGSISSLGLCVCPQTSQLSPYWFGRHSGLGQVPLTKRSARNVPATGS